MSEQFELLPFNFRHVPSLDKWLITNLSGAFSYLSSRDDIEAIVENDFVAIDYEIINELIAKNFITPPSEKVVRARIVASQMATQLAKSVSKPSLFMIVPTLRCDHDCGYCQVSRVPKDRKGYDIDLGHIDKILNVIAHIASDVIKIEFQGGEPLLAFDFIELFYQRALDVLLNIDISYVICTAAGPLDLRIIEWARDKKVDFSVSLDGPESIHTGNRPSKFFNTFETTTQAIKNIRQILGSHRVNCLTTISKHSLSFPYEIVDCYFNLGFPSIFLRPLSPFGFAASTSHRIGYSAQDYMKFYELALLHIIELNQHRTFVEEAALIHLRRIFQPHNAHYIDLQSPAGYVFGALVFNYDGRIFGSDEARMLWQSTKAEELVLGTIHDDMKSLVTGDATERLLTSSFLWASPGCDDCAYQPYCGADPLHHLATQGDPIGDKSFSFFCQYQTAMFDLLFSLWEKDMNARRVFTKWLTL